MDLGTAMASAWSSGISLYGVAALLGIAGRLDWVETAPLLQDRWCIAIALVLFVVELVVDKIALVDSLWDLVNTALRPAGAALIMASAPDLEAPTWLLAGGGALLALSSHAAKATARSLVNSSPEPASNVVVSAVEDVVVAGLMALALTFPAVAGALTLVLALASTATAVVLFTATRAVWRRLRRRRSPEGGPSPGADQ